MSTKAKNVLASVAAHQRRIAEKKARKQAKSPTPTATGSPQTIDNPYVRMLKKINRDRAARNSSGESA